MTTKWLKKGLLVLACLSVLALLALAACEDEEAKPRETPTAARETPTAGETPLASQLANKKVGVLSYIEAASGPHRKSTEATRVGECLGWEVQVADAEALPEKMIVAMQNFIAQKMDAAILLWITADQIGPTLPQAEEAGMIVTDIMSGPSEVEPWNDTSYDPGEVARLMVEGLVKVVGENGKVYAITDNDVTNPRLLWEATKRELQKHPGVELVGEHDARVEDLYADVQRATSTALTQFPDLDAFWVVADPQAGIVIAEIEAQGRTEVAVISSNGDPQILDAMRKNPKIATVGFGMEQGVWQVYDFILGTLAGKAPTGLPRVPAKLLTQENLPPEGQLFEGEPGFQEKFIAQWESEYGLSIGQCPA